MVPVVLSKTGYDHRVPNVLDGLQCFYEREKFVNEIEQSASENQKYNALHLSCGDVFDSYLMAVVPKMLWSQGRTAVRQHEAAIFLVSLHPLTASISRDDYPN